MAHRKLRDNVGREWDVWEVVPTAVERRLSKSAARPSGVERRKVQETRVLVPESLQRGWLAFQSAKERRRVAPIPKDWEDMTNGELLDLLLQADRRVRTRRLIE